MANQNDIEERIGKAVAEIERSLEGEPHLRWSIVRGLIHRAVHLATDKPSQVEFCALATYLAEMVGHAHKIAHGDNPQAPAHKDFVH
jgi:hypoxanthine-guanine phosphoribosyltransferase